MLRFVIAEFWSTHADLKQVEDIQAFGKMEEAAGTSGPGAADANARPEAVPDDSTDEDSDESDADAGDRGRVQPKVQNAFALLSDGDD